LIAREEVKEQHNATTKHLIQQAMPHTRSAHIITLDTAKDVCDYLTILFIGNKSIRCSRFEELKSEEANFIMYDNETPNEMYQRLKALAMALIEFGCNDNGTDCQEHVHCLHHSKGSHPFRDHSLKGRFEQLTSNEVLYEFLALTTLKNNAKATCSRALAS
jgi:hypothetical protein